MIVKCEALYESEVGKLDSKDLVSWLKALPAGHRLHYDIPQTHGRFYLKATWEEIRPAPPLVIYTDPPARRWYQRS